jgi:tetratricopeptide (TPR) repeat protein
MRIGGPLPPLIGLIVVPLLFLVAAGSLAACGGTRTTSTTSTRASFSVLIGAGTRLFQKGNLGAAEQVFAQAVAARPNDPVGHYDLGVVYEREGELLRAEREYRRALAEKPDYVPALYNQAGMIASHNRPLAIFYYRQVIKIRPNAATALLKLGLLEYAVGQLRARGLRDLAKAIQLRPALRAELPASVRARLPKSGGG